MSNEELLRLRTELIERDAERQLEAQAIRQLAQQALDKATSTAGWLNKLALGVLTAVVMAVLKDAGVI